MSTKKVKNALAEFGRGLKKVGAESRCPWCGKGRVFLVVGDKLGIGHSLPYCATYDDLHEKAKAGASLMQNLRTLLL